ncbi:hypothetical protein K8I61_18160 [bacterium]|nr:hypothetical protein [bacterium]
MPSERVLFYERIQDLVRAAQRVLDQRLRINFLGERLLSYTDDETLDALDIIRELATTGDQDARDAWALVVHPETLVERLDPFRKSRLYHMAVRREDEAVVALFSEGMAARRSDRVADAFFNYGLPEKTLGERVAKARSTDKATRERVRYDIEPRVIETYLTNPRTTETDVVRLAARRPADPKILSTIFRNERWISRYMVKLAVARNPYAPVNITRNLLPQLLRKDLLDIRDDPSLHMEIRRAALDLLEDKRKSNYDA